MVEEWRVPARVYIRMHLDGVMSPPSLLKGQARVLHFFSFWGWGWNNHPS